MTSEPFKNVHVVKTETFTITQCQDGYWLYDKTRGMNLAMRAESIEAAFTEALLYFQRRLQTVEQEHRSLKVKVAEFVGQFVDEDVEINV